MKKNSDKIFGWGAIAFGIIGYLIMFILIGSNITI